MGCGSSSNQAVVTPKAKPEEKAGDLSSRRPTYLTVQKPLTSVKKFSLPEEGKVEIVSMQYSLKYNGKNRSLEILRNLDQNIVSTLSWHTEKEDGEEFFDFELQDRLEHNPISEQSRILKTPPLSWRTDKVGHFIGIIDMAALEVGIFDQLHKDPESYSEERREEYMRSIGLKIRSMWGLFLENWLDFQENQGMSKEIVQAYGQECLFTKQELQEDPAKLREFMEVKLSVDATKNAISKQSFEVDKIDLSSDKIGDVTVISLTKVKEQHCLCRIEDRNPILTLDVEKRVVALGMANNQVFADISLQCTTNLFRWPSVLEIKEKNYEKEERENFEEECRMQESKLVSLIRSLRLPL